MSLTRLQGHLQGDGDGHGQCCRGHRRQSKGITAWTLLARFGMRRSFAKNLNL
jgi:hypothetical protein